jgi:hypothetical protein
MVLLGRFLILFVTASKSLGDWSIVEARDGV